MRFLTVVMAAVLVFPLPAVGQQAAMLNIVVVQGEGAINNIRQRTAREPIVRVEDENHKPVSGAAVVFTVPGQGASGTFTGGLQSLTVMTNNQGLAVARGFRPNNLAGQFEIRVTASLGQQTATAAIAQSNALAAAAAGAAGAGAGASAGILSAKLIAIIAIAAGAATAGGVVAATRSGGGNSNPTTIAPGTSTVGAPR